MAPLSPEQIEAFKRDSFLCLGQVFDEREMQQIRDAMERVLAAPPPQTEVTRESDAASPVRSVMGWEKADPVLDHFTRDERVLLPVQSLIGPNAVFHQTKWNPKGPGGNKWDPHRGISYWHFKDGVPDPEKIVSVFVAVTDQTRENGAVQTWKGAHHVSLDDVRNESILPEATAGAGSASDYGTDLSIQIREGNMNAYRNFFEQMDLTGPAGSVWLLDSRNLHASQPNLTKDTRILVANVLRSTDNVPAHPRPQEFICGTSTTPLEVHRGEW